MNANTLFSVTKPQKNWASFKASGFKQKVAGVVYQSGQSVCGLPLGGIATGCIDLNTEGTLGRCTCFNTIIQPRELGDIPFLALAVGKEVWGLTTKSVKGLKKAKSIHYWGHYPVADLHYKTGAPVDVSLRSWSPFIPGDAEVSNTPSMVFEVRISNPGKSRQKGSIAITLPGPTPEETGKSKISRRKITRKAFTAVQVDTGNQTDCVLAVSGADAGKARFGGELTDENGGFPNIGQKLPMAEAKSAGISSAVDFELRPGQTKIVRFVYSWYFPILDSGPHAYLHAYGPRFKNALDVTAMMVKGHEALLSRIIAWQEVIYGETHLPDWLKDCLVNTLYLFAEDAFWEANSIPPVEWAEETGMYSMVESTRTCPGQACIPSDFYGNFPVVYFFPRLALSTLRGFASFQRPNGEIPIYWGQNYERQNPYYQLLHVTSSCNYVDLVDRLWLRTGDDSIALEFFPSVKLAINYLQSLDADADGLLDCRPGKNCAHQFYGSWNWKGAAVHVEGMWLSSLQMAKRMAEKVGDHTFAKDCQVWWNLGQRSMEEKLWNGSYYMVYNDTTSKSKSDTILSNQLCGEWCSRLHGDEDVFPADKVKKALKVVKEKCLPVAKWGAAGAVRPNGKIDRSGGETSEGAFTPENLILAMTMLYTGDTQTGMKIAHETMHNLVLEQGFQWDLPNTIVPETGEWLRGHDFDQLMILWSLPAAILGQNLAEASGKGSFVEKILKAGK